MMSCCSSEKKHHQIASRILIDAQKNIRHKLLLLGPAFAGKSTIFKQLRRIYTNSYTTNQSRDFFKPAIRACLIEGIKILIKEAQRTDTELSLLGMKYASAILELELNDSLSPEIGQQIAFLWNKEPTIKLAFTNKSKFHLDDSAAYMLDHVERISQNDYLPTEEDIIRVRIRTSGVVETKFSLNKAPFSIIDVGGQIGERKKWIHCFDNVQAVLFVAALSEYDSEMIEIAGKNRMIDSIELFKAITCLTQFDRTAFILFLNKSDLFEEKMKTKKANLSDIFPEYKGGFDPQKGIEFIKKEFHDAHKGKSTLFIHVTCATDSNNIKHVFGDVYEIVLANNLKNCGLIVQ